MSRKGKRPPPWIDPYRLHPVGPRPALMLPDGVVIDCEDGDITSEAAPGVRAYTFAAWAADLNEDGHGELLQWNNRPIRWRRQPRDDDWPPSRSDVILIDAEEEEPADAMAGLVLLAEWLRYHGAQLSGTLSAASLSLLRASITSRLWLGIKSPPVIPIGGRQEMGPGGPGIKVGDATHWDIPAAYASTLGGIVYGGRWRSREPDPDHLAALHANGTPIIARAQVRVPRELAYGPMPRRPRRRLSLWEQVMMQGAIDAKPTYPRGKVIRGQWSWAEIQAAMDQGCSVTVTEAWAHVVAFDHRPFARWWERISEGRSFRGFASHLAKMMGNAMVGRFFDAPGRRTAVRWDDSGVDVREIPSNVMGGFSAPDLAEQVTSRVRAELGRQLNDAGEHVICAHTDGGWFTDGWTPTSEAYHWRPKEHARRIDILNPNCMAVFPADGGAPDYRVAGPAEPRRAFKERWAATFRVPYNPADHVIDPRDSELWAGVDAR